MQVSNCQNDYIGVFDPVDQPKRKPVDAAAAHAFGEQMPSVRIERDAAKGGEDFKEKGVAQTRGLCLIPLDGFVELDLRNF
jgi:hypothetical protein